MRAHIKKMALYALMFIIGAFIALFIYGIAYFVFHKEFSRLNLIVNVLADGIIFCIFSIISAHLKERKNNKNL